MKKTLIAIIAVMLVIVMCFTLFACNKDKGNENNNTQTDDNGGNTKPSKPTNTGKALTKDELGDYDAPTTLMVTYADQYLTNNATDKKDVSVAMQSALIAQANALEGTPIDKIAVKLESDDCYSLTFTYKNKDTYVYHVEGELQARVAEAGVFAGYTMGTDAADFESSLANVYNAFLRTVQKALADGEDFGEDYKASAIAGEKKNGYTFGGSVEGAFTFNYGTGEGQIGPMSYGLKVYGTLGYEAESTEVAIEVIDEQEDEVLVGLYYKNATLFLSIGIGEYNQKLYLDNADINAIVGNMLGESFAAECEHKYVDGYCEKCGKLEPEEAEEDPFYMHAPSYKKISDALSDLTGGNGMVGTVVKIVAPLLTSKSSSISGGTRYQYQIDLDALIKKLLGNSVLGPMISGAVNPVIASILPELDLGSFQGVGGTLTLSFDIKSGKDKDGKTADMLAGAQVAYNVAQKDFRWNKNDDEQKLYGPVNAAITVSDFSIGDETVEAKKVNVDNYNYFSPLNGEITADIAYVDSNDLESDLNGNYNLTARAEFNPFTLFAGDETREGKAEIKLDKADGTAFFDVYIHDFTYIEKKWDSVVTVYYNGTYYETKASESDFFKDVFEQFIKPLVSRNTTSNLKPISDYVWDLIDQFSKEYTAADFAKDVAKYKDEVDALAVTKAVTTITKDKDGKDVVTVVTDKNGDPVIMDSSDFLDGIKSKALDRIATLERGVGETEAARKEAIKEIAKIAKEAKSDYNKQLKLEGKSESIMDGFNIIALASNFSKLTGLFIGDEGAANPKVFDYTLDLTNPQLHADLDYKVYNSVIDILQAAIPKLEEFSRDAATVKVEMNTKGYEGKLWVNVEYGDYLVDVTVDIKDCIQSKTVEDEDGAESLQYYLASTCSMSADILIKIPDESGKVINYVYAATVDFDKWDKNNGTITVIFKESDGAKVTKATDEFVNMVITQSWDGEEYLGFDIALTLNSRLKDGSAMNEAHAYGISGKHVKSNTDDMYVLTFNDSIELGIGNFAGALDKKNTLSFDIPAPSCGFTFTAKMGTKDVRIDVTNLKISKWGSDMSGAIKGITKGENAIENTVAARAMDAALIEVVEELFGGFFYEPTLPE